MLTKQTPPRRFSAMPRWQQPRRGPLITGEKRTPDQSG